MIITRYWAILQLQRGEVASFQLVVCLFTYRVVEIPMIARNIETVEESSEKKQFTTETQRSQRI